MSLLEKINSGAEAFVNKLVEHQIVNPVNNGDISSWGNACVRNADAFVAKPRLFVPMAHQSLQQMIGFFLPGIPPEQIAEVLIQIDDGFNSSLTYTLEDGKKGAVMNGRVKSGNVTSSVLFRQLYGTDGNGPYMNHIYRETQVRRITNFAGPVGQEAVMKEELSVNLDNGQTNTITAEYTPVFFNTGIQVA